MAVVEARRRIRARSGLSSALFMGIGFGFLTVVVFYSALDYGASFGTGGDGWQEYVGPILLVATLALTVLQAIFAAGPQPANRDYLLTVRPAKDQVGAQLLLRYAQTLPLVVFPLGALGLGLGIAMGSPLPLAGAVAAALVVNGLGTTCGFALGMLGRGLGRRSGVSAWYVVVGIVPALLAYVAFLRIGGIEMVVEGARYGLEGTPLVWLGDLALLTTPGSTARPVQAFAALLGSVILSGIMVRAGVSAAEFSWFADRHAREEDDGARTEVPDESKTLFALALQTVCRSSASHGVAEVSIKRARRSPFLLLVLGVVGLLGTIPIVESLITTGSAPWYGPWLVLYYGVFLAGAQHSLNVLGSKGRGLPLLLTSRADPRQVVEGHVVAATLLFAPPTTLLVLVLGAAAGWNLSTIVAAGVLTPGTVLAGAILAVGIGVRFPRFQSLQVNDVDGIVPPNTLAMAAFSGACLFLVGTVALAAAALAEPPAVDVLTVLAVGALATAAGAVVIAHRHAVTRVGSHELV